MTNLHPEPEHLDRARNSIKIDMLIERLHDHVEDTRKMSSSQVAAAIALLRKTLPPLSAIDRRSAVTRQYVVEIPAPVKDLDEWKRLYGPDRTSPPKP